MNKEVITKAEFTNQLLSTLSIRELAMVNPQIYLNPKHIAYYKAYKAGNYNFCLDYLNCNRDLLNHKNISNSNFSSSNRRLMAQAINRAVKLAEKE